MRSLPLLLIAGSLAGTLAATTACTHAATIPSQSLTAGLTAPRQIVRIYNHSWDNLEISAVRNGGRRILGVISAAQDGVLVLNNDMLDVDGTVQLVARVEGKRDELRMQPTRVPKGDYIAWSLERDFTRSSVATFPL